MQAIIYNLLSNGNQNFGHISEYSPFYEIVHTWNLESDVEAADGKLKTKYEENHKMLGWRVFNTHLRWEMMPKQKNMRYIYVVRSGKDVALSFFQHLSNQDDADCFNGDFLDFVTKWCDGEIPFGNWIHHLQSWMRAYHSQERAGGAVAVEEPSEHALTTTTAAATGTGKKGPILLLRYEDLVRDPLPCVLQIIRHLELDIDAERAQELLQYVSFPYMKAHQAQYMPISVPWKAGYSFLRKGEVGDSANHFDAAHSAVFEAMVQRVCAVQEQRGVPDWLRDLDVL